MGETSPDPSGLLGFCGMINSLPCLSCLHLDFSDSFFFFSHTGKQSLLSLLGEIKCRTAKAVYIECSLGMSFTYE